MFMASGRVLRSPHVLSDSHRAVRMRYRLTPEHGVERPPLKAPAAHGAGAFLLGALSSAPGVCRDMPLTRRG